MTDYNFDCIVGVIVDSNSAYTIENITISNVCEHEDDHEDADNFCRICGQKLLEVKTSKRVAREDVLKKLGCGLFDIGYDDEEEDEVIDWANHKGSLPFQFIYHMTGLLWCGTYIAGHFHDDGPTLHKKKNKQLPEIPDRRILFQFLDDLSLKYKKSDYGLWTMCEHL